MIEDLKVPPLPEGGAMPPPIEPSAVWAGSATVGGALSAAWRLVRTQRAILAVILISVVASGIINFPDRQYRAPEASSGSFNVFLSMFNWKFFLHWIVFAITEAWLILAVASAHQLEEVPLLQAFSRAVFRAPALLATLVLAMVVSSPGFVLCVIPGFFVYAHFALAMPYSVLEEKGPIASLRFSWNGSVGLTGLFVLLIIIEGAAGMIPGIPLMAWDMKHKVYAEVTGLPLWHSCYEIGLILYGGVVAKFIRVAETWLYLERRAGRL